MNEYAQVELVLWDCDGVLVDSERLAAKAFYTIITDLGGTQTEDQVFNSLKGGSIYKAIDYVHSQITVPKNVDIEKAYRKLSFQLFTEHLQAVKGVEAVVSAIAVKQCVASNGPRIKIAHNLGVTGLMKYFREEHIFSGHDIQSFKPEPELFLHAAKNMGVDVNRCLVIEDSIHGVDAAIGAGMSCLAYVENNVVLPFQEKGVSSFEHMSLLHVLLKDIMYKKRAD